MGQWKKTGKKKKVVEGYKRGWDWVDKVEG